MDSSHIVMIFAFIALISLSALFSMSETAFMSINKIRIKTLAEENNKKAILIRSLLDDQTRLLSSVLVGNNLVNIAASSLTTSFVISLLGNEGTGVAIATGVVTLIILIFGEITPKSLATQNAESIAFGVCRFIKLITIIFTPVVTILNIVSGLFIRLFGGDANNGPTMTEEDLKTIVTVSHEEGVLEDEEKEMIHNVFEFGDTEIKEVMTPRIHVESISTDTTYDEVIEVFRESQFSRLPVHNDSYDEIVGVLYIKDLFMYDVNRDDFDVTKIMRETYFVYEFNQISDVFEAMRKDHVSLAVVLDEYGVMSGIVTLEDIVEEIVGEIDDEYDEILQSIVDLGHGEYLIDGSLNIDEVNDVCDTTFDSEDFESIGGLVLGQCNGSPEMNQVIVIDGIEFTIKEIDKNRIVLLHLKKVLEDEEEKGEEKQD
ncbi:hemolysin family protein [Allocoprobacillus halotolerans]|uniref:Hemolysin family protein n=1 Tax=Allocoprobacillus halotolerans TaxID=2944914 RepID=A0ABY5I0L7_9FIRM|nr:hemolysin family protein [Allocoprobacillus halotolerans]UTY38470.1 hemolysin family protein [Allocoprobacillus halotolerans]